MIVHLAVISLEKSDVLTSFCNDSLVFYGLPGNNRSFENGGAFDCVKTLCFSVSFKLDTSCTMHSLPPF